MMKTLFCGSQLYCILIYWKITRLTEIDRLVINELSKIVPKFSQYLRKVAWPNCCILNPIQFRVFRIKCVQDDRTLINGDLPHMCYWNVFVYAIQQWYSARRLWKSNFVYGEGFVVDFAMPLRWHSYFFVVVQLLNRSTRKWPTRHLSDGVIRTPVRVAIHETKIVCATKLFPIIIFFC